MRRLAFLSLLAIPATLGCSSSSPIAQPSERTGSAGQQIYYGQPDSTHNAVIAILAKNQDWACSGTIVAKNGSSGFVLTAAHCAQPNDPPAYVVYGTDYSDPNATVFQVTDSKIDPAYDANSHEHDFQMLTITGVSAQTPTIPVMTPAQDNLKAGSTVTFVGYGKTENNPNNTKRFYVSGPLADVYALTVDYGQQNGGPCEGDSGGPSLTTIGGQEVVSTVTSAGDQTCMQSGMSGRASAVWDTFINPYITGAPVGQQTCDQCSQSATSGQGACVSDVNNCVNDADCKALLQCLNACAQGDQACDQQCFSGHASGAKIYATIGTCICGTGCKAECASAPFCQQAPAAKCGFTSNATCQSCFENKCCAEGSACAADAVCATCFGQSPDPSCGSNAAAKAFGSCLQSSCQQECGGGGQGGAGQGGGGPINPGQGGGSNTGTGTGQGQGGAGSGTGAGNGSGNGNGNGAGGGDSLNSAPTATNSGCTVTGTEQSGDPLGALALAALGLVGVAVRRRR
jgi:MYXO-CTERM domain-containing protein